MWIHQKMELTAGQPPPRLLRLTYQLLCINETIDWTDILVDRTEPLNDIVAKNGIVKVNRKKVLEG